MFLATERNTPMAAVRTHRRSELLAVSAVAYLALALGLGVHTAFVLVVLAALIVLWAAACRRFPVVARLTHAFFFGFVLGLISGLFGTRGGYGYYRSYYLRYRHRRR
jgi:hypothetical protein